jgi:hypothetical protein
MKSLQWAIGSEGRQVGSNGRLRGSRDAGPAQFTSMHGVLFDGNRVPAELGQEQAGLFGLSSRGNPSDSRDDGETYKRSFHCNPFRESTGSVV